MPKITLGVIFGGMSTEHMVSISSGTAIIKNLNKDKYIIHPIYLDTKGKWYKYVKEIEKIEILPVGTIPQEIEIIENPFEYLKQLNLVIPVLHGLNGEDGTIQGMFELLKVPYVGCKVLSSSISMDKVYTKQIAKIAQINQAKYVYIQKQNEEYIYIDEEFNEEVLTLEQIGEIVKNKLKMPVFVKPSNSGSSVGITKANNIKELIQSIKTAQVYDSKIIIEENIIGREVECAVLGNHKPKASCIGEVLSAEDFYTFDAKYKNSASRTAIPADLPENIIKEIKKLAIKIFRAVDGKGLARVDFFVQKETSKVYFNEINTMPGFTEISMYPKLWEASGISYKELLDELIILAQE